MLLVKLQYLDDLNGASNYLQRLCVVSIKFLKNALESILREQSLNIEMCVLNVFLKNAHFCFWPKKRLSKSYETLESAQSRTESWLSVFITLFAKISVHLFLQNGNLEVSWLAPNMPEMRLRNFLTLLAWKCFIVPKTIKMSCMMRAKKAISLAARGVIVAPVIRGFND